MGIRFFLHRDDIEGGAGAEQAAAPGAAEQAAQPRPAARAGAINPEDQRPMSAVLPQTPPTTAPTPASGTVPWRVVGSAAALTALGIAALLALRPAVPPMPAGTPASARDSQAQVAAPAATALPQLARAVIAYAAPDGQTLGALEPGRGYRLIEERDGWRRLQASESGEVWVRAWEMDGLPPPTPVPTPIPTLEPTLPPASVPANVPITRPPQPVYVPPPAPAPTTCGENLYGRVCSDNPALVERGLAELAATEQARDAGTFP